MYCTRLFVLRPRRPGYVASYDGLNRYDLQTAHLHAPSLEPLSQRMVKRSLEAFWKLITEEMGFERWYPSSEVLEPVYAVYIVRMLQLNEVMLLTSSQ